ncbi:transposase [Vibrio mimicus]
MVGILERFFRTLKSEYLNDATFLNHRSVSSACERYIAFYNYKRCHSGLNYSTPHEHYKQMNKSV